MLSSMYSSSMYHGMTNSWPWPGHLKRVLYVKVDHAANMVPRGRKKQRYLKIHVRRCRHNDVFMLGARTTGALHVSKDGFPSFPV